MKQLVVELVNGRQLDLFELMATTAFSEPAKEKKKRVKIVRALSDEDYISKGERIETLAREKFAKVIKDLTFSTLEEKIYAVKYNSAETLFRHVAKIAKIFRQFVSEMDLSKDSDDYKTLLSLIDLDMELTAVDISSESSVGAVRRLRYRMRKCDDLVRLVIREAGWPAVCVYGYRKFSTGNEYLMTDRSSVADIGLVLAWLFVFTLYNRSIADPTMEGPLTEAFEPWKPVGPENYSELMRTIWAFGGYWRLKDKADDGRELAAKEILGSEINRQKSKLVVPVKEFLRPRAEVLDEFRTLFGLQEKDISVSFLKHSVLMEKNRETFSASRQTEVSQWELPCSIEYGITAIDPIGYFKRGFGRISYNATLSRAEQRDTGEAEYVPPAWPVPKSYTCVLDGAYELLKEVVKCVWQEKSQIVSKYNYYKGMESDKSVAKAYQTKKSIPLKVLKEMEESDFNNFFGYVEIDESCDLDKIRALAEEFSVFHERFLKGADAHGVSLRFRRIGNHKASGLYYPMAGCIVVDVTSPSSFIHEYGHCLDHLLGGRYPLSDLGDFRRVYSLYRNCLLNELAQNPSEYRAMRRSKSKYNLDYYLLNTEAFARCFEIYVSRVLRHETSLCKMDENLGWAYPKSEELTQSIKEYFDTLFVTVNGVAPGELDDAA